MRFRTAIALLAALSGAAQVPAADTAGTPGARWEAGAAKVDITPSEPIRMAGFPARDKLSQGVRQPIFARALALKDERGRLAVIATLDLATIDREMAEAIADRCRAGQGIERARLVVNVSHSHSGPIAGRALMPCYKLTPSEAKAVARYTETVIDKTVSAVEGAVRGLAPASVEFGQSLAGIAVNRRRLSFFRGLPGGPVDHDVPVLAARGVDGRPIAVVVGYACHASALRDYQISNDWPGYALEELDRNHPGAVSLFVQGCGGDSGVFPRQGAELARERGTILAAAVEEVLGGRMTPLAGPLEASFARVDIPFGTLPSREELGRELGGPDEYRRRSARYLLAALDRDGRLPASYPYPVQVWTFGRGLTFIALGGEAVVDYALRFKREYGFDTTWVAAYSNDVMAYIPSSRVLQEGGYEGADAMVYFGRPGPWGAPVEDVIAGKVGNLIGRTLSPGRQPQR